MTPVEGCLERAQVVDTLDQRVIAGPAELVRDQLGVDVGVLDEQQVEGTGHPAHAAGRGGGSLIRSQ